MRQAAWDKKKLAKPALFMATVIWGASFVLTKNAVETVPPGYLMALRFGIGFMVLALVFFKRLKKITRGCLAHGALAGLCLFLAYAMQTIGITDTTPGKSAFLTAVYCVIVPFLFGAVNRTWPDRWNVAAALACLSGIGFVSLSNGLSIRPGDSLTLLAGFFFAAHIVVLSKVLAGKDPIVMTIIQFGFAAVYSLLAALLFESPPGPLAAETWGEIAYLSVGCTAVAILFQTFGQKYTDPSVAALLLSLESVNGAMFSILFYHEQLTLRLGIGFFLIFAAVVVSETKLSFLFYKAADQTVLPAAEKPAVAASAAAEEGKRHDCLKGENLNWRN